MRGNFTLRIVGSGEYFPSARWGNQQIIDLFEMTYPKEKGGGSLKSNMPARLWGIRERALDLVASDDGSVTKSGLYDAQMAANAAEKAITQAAENLGMEYGELAAKIGVVVEASSTLPLGVGHEQGQIIKQLGLGNVDFDSKRVGCAGILTALNAAERALYQTDYVLVMLSNCPSQQFATSQMRHDYTGDLGFKACALMFSDGAVAFVLKRGENEQGFFKWTHSVKHGSNYALIEVLDGAYFMHAEKVAQTFVPVMEENWKTLGGLCREHLDSDPLDVADQILLHQASLPGVVETAHRIGLVKRVDSKVDEELATYFGQNRKERDHELPFRAAEVIRPHLPTVMQQLGNPAAASIGVVLHRALNDERFEEGALFLGMVIGAGRGGTEHGVFMFRK